jgi:hypothetical protein
MNLEQDILVFNINPFAIGRKFRQGYDGILTDCCTIVLKGPSDAASPSFHEEALR